MKRILFTKDGWKIVRTKRDIDLAAMIAEYGATISNWMANATKFVWQAELKVPASAGNEYAKGVFRIASNPETGDSKVEFHRSWLVENMSSAFPILLSKRKPVEAVAQTAEEVAQNH